MRSDFQLPNCYSEWCDLSGNYFIIEEYIRTQVRNNIFDYQPVLVASNNIGKTPSLSRISKYMNLVILSLANINNDLSRNHYKYLEYFVDSSRVSYHTFSQIYLYLNYFVIPKHTILDSSFHINNLFNFKMSCETKVVMGVTFFH